MKKPLLEYVCAFTTLSQNGVYSILDFGCGMGDFLGLVSKRVNAESKLLGIDSDEQAIKAAKDRYPDIDFACKKFDDKLDLPDASSDMVVTIDVIECISDKQALINEFHRILRPQGKVVAAHWDWDTMTYSVQNKDAARKAVSAFSDWKQPWMDNCDGQMGRKLWGLFEGSKKFQGKADSFTLIETSYEKGKYGFDRMQDIAKIVDQGRITREEHQHLHDELTMNNNKGQYFFGLTSFIYYGQKI